MKKEKVIIFNNVYGSFSLEIGKRYDFTLIDIQSGNVYPNDDAEIVGQDETAILIKYVKKVVRLEKEIIVDAELFEEF